MTRILEAMENVSISTIKNDLIVLIGDADSFNGLTYDGRSVSKITLSNQVIEKPKQLVTEIAKLIRSLTMTTNKTHTIQVNDNTSDMITITVSPK